MSKRGYISRYMMILKKLKSKPYSSFEEITSYMESQIDYLQMNDDTLNIGFSKRTLQRDLKEIRNIFGIDIEYSPSSKGYFISQDEIGNMNFERMIEAFDMFNSLNLAQDLKPFIHLESRQPQGTENLYGLLHAIKNKLKIKFIYKKFWEQDSSTRHVEPYVLKEFKSRWYVMAKDLKDDTLKSFALDRLSNLEITISKYEQKNLNQVEENYRYCFGIISPNEAAPYEIILSFTALQGKFIKTLPLHSTQQIIKDTEEELQIKLKLFITYDFIMELLSHGDNVKVIKPKILMNKIKAAHQDASNRY
ncbi:MAG: WYL domain-containing protein [Bacteroidota bacterium]